MNLVVGPGAGQGVVEAVRTAVARMGVELADEPSATRSTWWSAGLAEAVERGLPPADGRLAYDVARSPRSTRGATRA